MTIKVTHQASVHDATSVAPAEEVSATFIAAHGRLVQSLEGMSFVYLLHYV